MEAIEARMMQRNWHLTERCAFYGLDQSGKCSRFVLWTCSNARFSKTGNDTLHKPNPWEFLISKKHHLVWCNVFKAASTSWMYNFNLLAGYTPQFLKKSQIVPLTLARKKYPRPSVAQVSSSLNFRQTYLIGILTLISLPQAHRCAKQFN